jgi:hypothetical protein
MLYHFSEEPTIRRFVPRSPLARPEVEPLVWTIHEDYQHIYWVPRDCPRVCFWPLPESTETDLERFWSGVTGRMVIAIEAGWVERLQITQLYRYTMPPESFTSIDTYGAFVSRETLEPLSVEPMGNLLEQLAASPVELRLCPSLEPIGEAIIGTSLHWSIIRRRNAQGWATD